MLPEELPINSGHLAWAISIRSGRTDMAARVGASSRHGAKKWLASLFGEAEHAAASSSSKSVAKERLQIILAHQRGSQVLAGVDLAALQQGLLECVQRHIKVANGANINIAGGCTPNHFNLSSRLNEPFAM
ncbi:unnamed protein product [Phytophthora lilii]|uniref:Unnamed protein product n=1 Tax=Phytophthora lilii TaxID=2077276 RepID=A0A9W6WRC1_9STRA|nr:unnamed protein product [Phytophthora lilii]